VVRLEGRGAKEQQQALAGKLKDWGHNVVVTSSQQGDAHSIAIDPQTSEIQGVADRRLDGWAAGY
jgi:gamma-glutamyltranspeptidase